MHFILYSNVNEKKKKKKNCKFDGPFSVQDPNCFSIFLMRVLHRGFELTNRVRVLYNCGLCMPVYGTCVNTVSKHMRF